MKLCVAIPTYNRKERLERTLGYLENQTTKDFLVVISDNHSEYEVEEVLNAVSDEFKERISIYRNTFNIGMSGNIASLFDKASADWCWFFADDDYPYEGAVETILNDIEQYENRDISVIQYPHIEISKQIADEYTVINNLDSYISYFSHFLECGIPLTNVQGMLIYLANKVYRIDRIGEYVRYAYDYCNTGIPQTIPILKALDEGSANMLLHNKIIVRYNWEEDISWNVRKVALGMSTIKHLPLLLGAEEKKSLWYLIMIRYKFVFEDYFRRGISDYDYLYSLYESMYKYILKDNDREYYLSVLKHAMDGTEMEYLGETFM